LRLPLIATVASATGNMFPRGSTTDDTGGKVLGPFSITKREMFPDMISRGHDHQVHGLVVELVAIDVVDVLGSEKWSSDDGFHDDSMLISRTGIGGDNPIVVTHIPVSNTIPMPGLFTFKNRLGRLFSALEFLGGWPISVSCPDGRNSLFDRFSGPDHSWLERCLRSVSRHMRYFTMPCRRNQHAISFV